MNLSHVKCISAHRTPRRHELNRPGVVIAELYSLEDKQAVLERKRFLRNVPQYTNVFIKSAKSHTEQVMDANFSVVLNEMSNGDLYYISDNGRIQHKYNRGGDNQRSGAGYGGARPKTFQYRGVGDNRYTTFKNTGSPRDNLYHIQYIPPDVLEITVTAHVVTVITHVMCIVPETRGIVIKTPVIDVTTPATTTTSETKTTTDQSRHRNSPMATDVTLNINQQ